MSKGQNVSRTRAKYLDSWRKYFFLGKYNVYHGTLGMQIEFPRGWFFTIYLNHHINYVYNMLITNNIWKNIFFLYIILLPNVITLSVKGFHLHSPFRSTGYKK